jgi:hypothetical protein
MMKKHDLDTTKTIWNTHSFYSVDEYVLSNKLLIPLKVLQIA